MKIEPTQLHARKIRHQEALKAQIARCLEKEVNLKAEERQERARQLGIDWNNTQSADDRRLRRTKPALNQVWPELRSRGSGQSAQNLDPGPISDRGQLAGFSILCLDGRLRAFFGGSLRGGRARRAAFGGDLSG